MQPEQEIEFGVCSECGHEIEWMGANISCESDELEDGEVCEGIYRPKAVDADGGE